MAELFWNRWPNSVGTRNGTLLACGGFVSKGVYTVEVWNVATGQLLERLPTSAFTSLNSLAFTPDGKLLLDGGCGSNNGSAYGLVEVWDLSSGKLNTTLSTSEGAVSALAVSPNGKLVAVGGSVFSTTSGNSVGRAELWDLATKKILATLPVSSDLVPLAFSAMNFSQDGKTVFASGYPSIQAFSVASNTMIGYLITPLESIGVSADVTSGVVSGGYGNLEVFTLPAITAAKIQTVTFKASSILNYGSSEGTVTLSGPAPAGGLTIALQSTQASSMWQPLSMPTTVTIPAGKRSATFTITAPWVSTPTKVSVTAVSGPYFCSGNLTILCPDVSSLTLSSSSVVGGASVTGTVKIDQPAGEMDPAITVSSNNSAVTIQTQPSYPTGSKTATFKITTNAVSTSQVVTITAKGGSTTKTVTLTVKP